MNKASIILCLVLLLSFKPLMSTSADTLAPLAVITVDTTIDTNDSAHQLCTGEPNDCSLRGAISKSNATSGGIGTIILPSGTYQLTLTGANEYTNTYGSLDIWEPVTIQGFGITRPIIQAGPSKGNGIDRVFSVNATTGRVTFSGIDIRWGTISSGGAGGGGIYQQYDASVLFLEHVTVSENTVTVTAPGGGILSSGTLTIEDSTISDNAASSHEGGGIYHTGELTIERSTISGNTAGSFGGGIGNQDVAILRNVTISGNSAGEGGGGISQWNDGDLTIYNSTIANNTVTGGSVSGWAIDDPRTFVAYNSILSSASGSYPCVHAADGGDHNIASNTGCGSAFAVADPLLGLLADNHGSTRTHSLLPGSPAIDAGFACEVDDQRGIIRPIDGDGDGLAICDIGSFERQVFLFLPLLRRP